jgi:uncharacterized membrane protein
MFQCIARAVLGYPLTVLEVYTLVHAVCALLMYRIWFRKPFDVSETLLLDISPFMDDLALMLLRTRCEPRLDFWNRR